MHFLKKGQKNRAWVDPPLIRAMPERKRFFSVDVFPYLGWLLHINQSAPPGQSMQKQIPETKNASVKLVCTNKMLSFLHIFYLHIPATLISLNTISVQ